MSTQRAIRERAAELIARESAAFAEQHPRSRVLFERARHSLLEGVPMPWMTQWASPFPLFVGSASGAHFTDVDGNRFVDFCLGDTGAMAGHGARPVTEALARQAAQGITFMLPTEDSIAVANELTLRFGVSCWQFALSGTDANRFVLRLARKITARSKVLVFNWCYHGSVDEALVVAGRDGRTSARPENIGPAVDPDLTTVVVEWNDVEALDAALSSGEIACVLAEPALTNIGIVAPSDGYHERLRELTRKYGTLLVLDETHTICCGPGGFTGAHDLQPDVVTIGKTIGGGVPAAAYGFSAELLARIGDLGFLRQSDVGGVGGTLAGNALSIAAIRATLEHVLTAEAFDAMAMLADRFERGVAEVIQRYGLPWHVTRLGVRVEYWASRVPPRNGGEAAAAADPVVDRFLHLYLLNRGVLMTPFHNMALMCPATTEADVERHSEVFDQAVGELVEAGVPA